MEFLLLKWGWGIKVQPLCLLSIPTQDGPAGGSGKPWVFCHLCIKEAHTRDEIAPQQVSHLRSGLILVGVSGAGWIRGLLVMDGQRSSAEHPDNDSPVFFPNSVGRLKLEFHLVYLALRAGVSYDSFPVALLSRSVRERQSNLLPHTFGLCLPLAHRGSAGSPVS